MNNSKLSELQQALWVVDRIAEELKSDHPEAYAAIYQSQAALRAKLYDLECFQLVVDFSSKGLAAAEMFKNSENTAPTRLPLISDPVQAEAFIRGREGAIDG